MPASTRSAKIRTSLGYPVIDGDGHYIDLRQPFCDFVTDHGAGHLVAGGSPFAALAPGAGRRSWRDMTPKERHRWRQPAPPFWIAPGETRYWATVTTPSLYHERLGEAGIDFAVLYATQGFGLHHLADDEARITLCRLFNEYLAEQYRDYADRLTPAALIPMHTPSEAVAGLEHARALGLKVANIPSYVWRPVAAAEDRVPPELAGQLRWIDTYGLDSEHDYDPVWATAVELGMPLACHSVAMGFTDRASTSNYMYNHIGHFAAAGEALAKSLFLGGVTRRFPGLRVALLEGGAAVGVRLLCDLVARWTKRGGPVLGRLNPANIDPGALGDLLARHHSPGAGYDPTSLVTSLGHPEELARDDFAATGVRSVEDIVDAFCSSFFWGCEADDPLVGLAFDGGVTPLGARVPAFMGSDLGHWDVPEFSDPLAEAHELVERGILDEEQLRAFVFTEPVRFYAGADPGFFAGTAPEREVRALFADAGDDTERRW